MIASLDGLLYQVANLFLLPALLLITAALVYCLYSLGTLLIDGLYQRRGHTFGALSHYAKQDGINSDDLELWIMQKLELLRLTSRVTPLLGLVATLIPMGPALLALSNNNTAAVGENMVVAFAGVTLALIAASISFVVLNIRRRWLFSELRQIEKSMDEAQG